MFVLFLAEPPRVNCHYERVKVESEAWFAEKCRLNARRRRVISETDFSYFCAITAADAGPQELRTLCDWGNWVFPFDDLFDNGNLKENPEEAQKVIDVLLSGMEIGEDRLNTGTNSRRHSHLSIELQSLVDVHESVWTRIAQDPPIGVQRRFAKYMNNYCKGSIEQVQWRSQRRFPSLQETLEMRRKSAGVSPLFALAEYALKLDLPDEVFECESIKEIERIGVDFVVIQNDILSYCKEEDEGVRHNLVAITRYELQSTNPLGTPHPQAAFDSVGALLADLYQRWFLALAKLPSWGEKIDIDVQRYIASVRAVIMANLNWSFRSERYFGRRVAEVRRTRVVQVLKKLP
ncbi:terpene synthase metal binding domain protein [Talaromyces proteolyticus]|uniref:Terpene synthase n=1 Tax=Talaromyces proteolyticus TaxID=1131652 RepID=A0AAD4PXD5_9EURO|nr:terpene synthase metal binding domain protein [Talaromyces proteolyticus]KAH8693550.1 terpene synthase metal binding domain protein [Talaromyces proteolyticus]